VYIRPVRLPARGRGARTNQNLGEKAKKEQEAMKRSTRSSRTLVIVLGLATTLGLAAMLTHGHVGAAGNSIFGAFSDPDGVIQAATANKSLNQKNAFFDPGLGTNGQACVTCHQPSDGFDIHVSTIQDAFAATNGLDPLFRPNDTADRPDADVSTPAARVNAYNLMLNLGVIRFARPVPATANFTVDMQNTAQFGPQPHTGDPQNLTASTISVFRRPLVNVNVGLDSSILWDGRESITDLRTQVTKAAKSLLLAHDVSTAAADDVATFMLQVYVDQGYNNAPGSLSAAGATAGVTNLLALASDPAQPCRYDKSANLTSSITPNLGLLTPPSCTPVDLTSPHTMTVFDAWANLPNNNNNNAARAAVARGQAIFNTKALNVPTDLISQLGSAPIHCSTCHAVNNVGNHPDANFFVRNGTDSVDILKGLVANPSTSDVPSLQSLVDRMSMLPQYTMRSKSDPTMVVTTTDPGRALVTGHLADVGKFKPPVLRGFAARAPYFHSGAAIEDDDLVNFYNARFQIGLTDQEHEDLVAFLTSF
jgi:cytochrome c peroxidase